MAPRVLVVEDEPLVAMLVEEALQTAGCAVVGPIAELAEAQRLMADASLSGAILDFNVRGGNTAAVAKNLMRRRVPILLMSAYDEHSLPADLASLPRLTKPYTSQQLEQSVRMFCTQVLVK